LKKCSKCGAEKPLGEFNKNKNAKDGARSQCRECTKIVSRRRYADDPEKVLKSTRKWQEANPEKCVELRRQWRRDNPEKCLEMGRKWRKANAEKCKEFSRKWRAANPEKVRESDRKRRESNPKKHQENFRRWKEANPEAYLKGGLRSKRKRQDENYLYLGDVFGPACLDCGREYPMPIFEYHHLDPATKNGPLSIYWQWPRVEAYVRGCVQLCPTCHRLRHFLDWEKCRKALEVVD
jgi:hypothetical protein